MDFRVHRVLRFMEQNLRRNIPLSELAVLIGLSTSRLRHLFSVQTGLSPKQCLVKLRLARARRLLSDSSLSIDQIALEVGWQDRSHFERRFKRHYGMTPARYRNSEHFNAFNNETEVTVYETSL
jgi:AraC family transcriptional regulator